MTAVEEVPTVRRATFPAVVTTENGQHRTALAVVTTDRLMVWTTRGRPILDLAYDPARSIVPAASAPSSRPAHLATVTLGTVTVQGQRGCGCGSSLKGWRPWRPWRVVASS